MSSEGSSALGSGVEERLERLARTAGRLLGVPVALIVLPDGKAVGGPVAPVWPLVQRVVDTGERVELADVATEWGEGATVASFAGVPIQLGPLCGVLCVADIEPRAWTSEELAVLVDLAGAVEAGTGLPSGLPEAGLPAVDASPSERAELAVLSEVTARLTQVRAVDEAGEVVIAAVMELLGASGGVARLRRADGSLAVAAAAGGRPGDLDDAQVSSEELVVEGPVVHVPLRAEGIRGVVSFVWPDDREPTADVQELVGAVVRQSAEAMERARLRQREREAQGRLAFLADASRALADTLDFDGTLDTLARLAVPAIADICAVHLFDESGPVLISVAAADAEVEQRLRERAARRERRTDPLVDAVALTGQAEAEGGGSGELQSDERVVVPMRAHGRLIGALALSMHGSGRTFSDDASTWLHDFAARAATAIDNARLYHSRKAEAETLQRSLLPPSLPLIPGLEAEARYRPATESHQVGGDFFDVFPAGGDRWGFVMGDVSGKGVGAAAVTSLARYTVRAIAPSASEPADVLEAVNRATLEAVGERFCTAVFGFARVRPGGASLRLALGGHPPPVLVSADGELRTVGRQGTVLGVLPDPELHDVTVELNAGESLVLFTDGAVEVRAPDGTWAVDLVERTLSEVRGADAAGLASALERAVVSFSGGSPRDDLGILVLRVPDADDLALGPPVEERLPAHLVASFFARQRTRPWLSRQGLGARRAEDMVLVVSELVTNAARAGHELVLLRLWRTKQHVVVEVTDDGEGFVPPAETSLPAPDAEAGRGLYLVWSLADEIQVNPGPSGTVVRCRFRV